MTAAVDRIDVSAYRVPLEEPESDGTFTWTDTTVVVAELVAGAMQHTAPGAIVCLTGVAASRQLSVDVGALNNELVLENDVVFGSVNANKRHFEQAVNALCTADPDWLRRLITRTVPLESWTEALERGDDDIKSVVDFSQRQ